MRWKMTWQERLMATIYFAYERVMSRLRKKKPEEPLPQDHPMNDPGGG